MAELTDGQRASCANCGRRIVWHFDADGAPFGFWYDAEHMTEVCAGPDGDPVDDLWHEPVA